ncbi:response regulator [Caenimonas aquaedulcis]|uniref:Virulence sensor protein BvgS n=1 Tax=Caenimonas aquaedulcis TaxID=2793270 RepID=A0A931H3J8_9BURK|nr:response regulator [Caenimonas aquaedulcis]MBG9387911.1 response regulator [Caenimonas aquaedulcis]
MPEAVPTDITDSTDARNFKRILTRNVALPLAVGIAGAALFVFLIVYLLHTISWVEHTDQVLRKAGQVEKLTVDKETGLRGFLITGDESFLAPYEVAVPQLRAESEALKQLVLDNPLQSDRLSRIQALQEEWDKFAAEMITLRRANGDYSQAIRSGRGKRLTDQIRTEYDDFVATERRLRLERNDTASRNAILVVVIYLAFSLILSGLLAFNGRRELMRLSATFSTALAQREQQAGVLQSQAWLRDGQRMLVESLSGKQDLPTLGHNALEFLAQYLGSAVGAMYVQSADGRLERVAAWGYAADAAEGRAFAPRDSIVSEVAASARQIRLDSVPEDYIRVTSGLGHGAPASVLVSPLMNDGVVNGVIELGWLRPIQERDAELLQLARSNVGASVEAARYRQRLQDSLEETQQLNEELQVQQEELRTANEELEEQSRALKESQAHLESQQAELEQINVKISEQRDALDEKNEALNAARHEVEHRAVELERASRYKSEFLANMSHELRTPLNSSLILARLLADNAKGNLDEEQVKFSESIYSAGNDLLNLINDILDIAKVEAGKLEVRAEITGISALAQTLRRTFEPLAGQKHLDFELTLAPGLPETIFTDRQRIEQILKNLLSNALKFTDSGKVSMLVQRHGEREVAFKVTDSGIGIAPDQQELIFEAFRQADGTTSRRYGGTGLGLSISRDLARLLGGSISVESRPGHGSTFTLVLPVQYEEARGRPAEPTATPAPAPSFAPTAAPAPATSLGRTRPPPIADDRELAPAPAQRRVLVVEDEPQFAQILRDLAHELGYQCIVAQQADEAFELAERYAPDAMLLDMRLPDSSGLSVLQRIKDNPKTRHIPVHVISVEDLSETALQMGAIGYARKPASREELREVFGRLEAKLSQKVKRVLVVEDDKLQRESIARLIGDEDIQIETAESGAQALQLLHTDIFDCMIIDLKLPDMPGNEVLKRMASEEIRSFPPVIVYTGRNLTREEEAELSRYSRSIIIKGARSPERLLDEVTLFLHKVETELSTDRQKMLRVARNRDKVFEGRRVLLVDDDVRNIFALTSALESKGAVVEIARNGQEALDKLAETAAIDLVLMDIMMPGMDGYTATREIRKNPKWRNLPIIAVTAKAMKDDQERCLAAGANDYLAKPIELERLFSLIRVWMPKLERI